MADCGHPLQGESTASLICSRGRQPGDDTRCPSIALGWKRWLLVSLTFVVGDSPATAVTTVASASVESKYCTWIPDCLESVESETMSQIPGYEALLSSAQLAVEPGRLGSFPWESNALLAEVFGGPVQLEPEFKRPRIEHEYPAGASTSSKPEAGLNQALKAQLKKVVPRCNLSTGHLTSNAPEAGRQQAINAWLSIIKLDLNSSTVGRQIISILGRGHTKDQEAKLVLETVELSVRSDFSSMRISTRNLKTSAKSSKNNW